MLKLTLNGYELAYERRGKGTPLLLVHGFPLDHTIWEPLLPLLEDQFDLVLPDLRGFGWSGRPASQYSLRDMSADLLALLEHLEIENALVAGHSMGGYIAMDMERAFPRRILGLGLVATQPAADSAERKASRAQEAMAVIADGVAGTAERMAGILTSDPDLQKNLKSLILRQDPGGVAGALLAMADRDDSTELLSHLDLPVVIIHGLQDAIIPVEKARQMNAMLKQGALVTLEGAGHMPMMESPRECAEALLTLLH